MSLVTLLLPIWKVTFANGLPARVNTWPDRAVTPFGACKEGSACQIDGGRFDRQFFVGIQTPSGPNSLAELSEAEGPAEGLKETEFDPAPVVNVKLASGIATPPCAITPWIVTRYVVFTASGDDRFRKTSMPASAGTTATVTVEVDPLMVTVDEFSV